MKKSAVKQKKTVRFAEGDSRRKYAEAVEKERQEQAEGVGRESPNTGGSSASTDRPGNNEEKGDDDEFDEGREHGALASPEGPSKQERETHNLTHIPFRDWCEHCVRARARRRAHKRRKKELKKEELQRVTRIYMDFYYNGIGEEEEEKEEDEGVKNEDDEHKEDSPSIVLYDSNQRAVAS